ncbi:unnamed protein product [Xylocopa violacea]|uniref:RING-type domain-containing protein n=1 Tax=Xylocopa violacea TaxID=135666 RepID=A0ABP1PAH2_XYLVO
MACEACKTKFSFLTRKKQCMDCLRYFCSECVIKRLDKILSCDPCCMLSRRPLIRCLIVQMHSKDLRHYLLAKKISIKGCVEKEDLIKLLLIYANGTSDYRYVEDVENTDNSHSTQSANQSGNSDSAQGLNETRESNATSTDHNETSENIRTTDFSPDERVEPAYSAEETPVKLSDINALSELEYLSVKQLKNLLNTNRVNYKGCIERYELLNRASKLWEEYKQSRTTIEIPYENLCKICWDEPIECVILECGHMACCVNCGKQMSECPLCKQYVVRVVRCFKS